MYYAFQSLFSCPSPNLFFSRLCKYFFKKKNLFTSPVFPDLCSNFLLSSWQQFGSLSIYPLSCDVLPFCAEVAGRSVSHKRCEQLVQHPVDTTHSGIFLFAMTCASKCWLVFSLWSASFLQCWLLGHYSSHLSMHGHLILLFQGCAFHSSLLKFLVLVSYNFSNLLR